MSLQLDSTAFLDVPQMDGIIFAQSKYAKVASSSILFMT